MTYYNLLLWMCSPRETGQIMRRYTSDTWSQSIAREYKKWEVDYRVPAVMNKPIIAWQGI